MHAPTLFPAPVPATFADIPELHVLIETAYRGTTARAGWTHESDLLEGQRTDPEALAAMLADPAQAILGFRDEVGLFGCVALRDLGAGAAYLGLLTVDPARQAGGIGRTILAHGEAHARTRFGATRIEMTVIGLRRRLIEYYGRRGYRLTGETRPFPYGDARFGIPLRDDLDFVVLEKTLT